MNTLTGNINRRLRSTPNFEKSETAELKSLQVDYEILQEKYTQLEQMMRALPMSLVLTDRDGRITYANEALKEMIHQPQGTDMTGRSIFEFTTTAGKKILEEFAGPTLLSKGQWQGEVPVKCPDGTIHPVEAFGTMIRNDSGEPYFLLSNFQDINQHSKAEKALRENQKMLKTIMDSTKDCIYIKDRNFRYVLANPSLERFYNRPLREILGKTDDDILDKAQAEVIRGKDLAALQGQVLDYEIDFSMYGKITSFNTIKFPIHDETGRICGIGNIARDLTERNQAEVTIRQAEENYRSIFENALEGIYQSSPDGRYRTVNDAFARIFGFDSPKELMNSVTDIGRQLYADPKARNECMKMLEEKDTLEVELEVLNKQGDKRWITNKIRVYRDKEGHTLYYEGFVQDITERKMIMEELSIANQYLRDVIDFLPDPTFVVNPEGEVVFWNRCMEQMTGISKEKVLGRSNFTSHLYDENRQVLIDLIFKTYKETEEKYDSIERLENNLICGEIFVPFAYGRGAHLWGMAGPLRDKSGQVIGAIETMRDMTRMKESQEALIQSESRYRKLFGSIRDAIILMDEDVFIDCNPGALKLFDSTREELRGKHFHECSPLLQPNGEDSRKMSMEKINRAKTGKYQFLEWQLCKSEGTLLDTEISLCPIEIQGQALVLAIIRDVTERKMLKEELIRVRKLESIGILTGGIAHDLNNLFSAMMGSIFLAKMELHNPERALKRLTEAETTGLQVKEITNRFITFSEGGEPLKTTQNLNKMIKTTLEDFSSAPGIQWSFKLAGSLHPVSADEEQIRQVIQHLVQNAIEAMPGGGLITLSTEDVFLSAGQIPLLKKGDYIKCMVKDQGIGIPCEHMDRIFDPYFTTKPMGNAKGSGLGLAICHSIIKKHDGAVTCTSRSGAGSTFSLYLPAPRRENEISRQKASDMSGRQRKHILVMDDEDSIRKVMVQLLNHLGYEVELAADGEEAVEKYVQAKRSDRPFDVLLLDLTIRGGTGGYATIQKIRSIDPEVKAVIFSGHIHDPVIESCGDYGFCAALTKPFTVNELDKTLSRALAQ